MKILRFCPFFKDVLDISKDNEFYRPVINLLKFVLGGSIEIYDEGSAKVVLNFYHVADHFYQFAVSDLISEPRESSSAIEISLFNRL